MGRPGLGEDDLKVIFGELSVLTPRTRPYRAKRRELASRFERTESLIDKRFRDMVAGLAIRMSRTDKPQAE